MHAVSYNPMREVLLFLPLQRRKLRCLDIQAFVRGTSSGGRPSPLAWSSVCIEPRQDGLGYVQSLRKGREELLVSQPIRTVFPASYYKQRSSLPVQPQRGPWGTVCAPGLYLRAGFWDLQPLWPVAHRAPCQTHHQRGSGGLIQRTTFTDWRGRVSDTLEPECGF